MHVVPEISWRTHSQTDVLITIVIFERGLIVVVICGVVCWASAADVDIVG